MNYKACEGCGRDTYYKLCRWCDTSNNGHHRGINNDARTIEYLRLADMQAESNEDGWFYDDCDDCLINNKCDKSISNCYPVEGI